MTVFSYRAYDKTGSVMSEEVEANSLEEAKKKVLNKNLKILDIAEKKENNSLLFFSHKKDKITDDDIEFITAELSLLLDSGVKIDKALEVLSSAKSDGALSYLLKALSSDVRKGMPLSKALESHPKIFDSLYVNLVKIGESSGKLSLVFSGLAKDLKYKQELRNKIMQATAYPLVVFFVCILSVLFIFNFVVPKLTVMFIDVAELPIYTEVLLSVSEWFQTYQFALGGILVATVVLLKRGLENNDFSRKFDNFLATQKPFSTFTFLVERIRYASSMSLMLSSGVKVDQALVLSAASVKNAVISRNLMALSENVRKGSSITECLSSAKFFPELYISLVEVGEESGNMAPVFNEIANRSREKFSSWTTRLTSIIEPLMILFMGAIVGSVVVIMLMSIVSVNDVSF